MKTDINVLIQLCMLFISITHRVYFDYYSFFKYRSFESVFLNVGNGDSIITKFDNGSIMLVDFGNDNMTAYYLGRKLPLRKHNLEYVVLSHPHADHMGALGLLSREYRFNCFIYSGIQSKPDIPTNFVKPLNDQRISSFCRSEPFSSALTIKTYYYGDRFPLNKVEKNPNLSSIITVIESDIERVFLMGDSESIIQDMFLADLMMSEDEKEKKNVIKVPHQGSRDSINKNLINYLNPVLAVFSTGRNPYGHPHSETIDFYLKYGSSILRTDKNGDIYVR